MPMTQSKGGGEIVCAFDAFSRVTLKYIGKAHTCAPMCAFYGFFARKFLCFLGLEYALKALREHLRN